MPIVLNTDDGIEITSVDEYMREISILNQNKKNPNAQLFFRGQAVDYWDIRPSIFREQMLSVEHYLMSEPLRQVPNEFINLGGSFEIMEKYQHYGMCTRLLDVTTNPLVALYFACEHYDAEEYKDSETGSVEKMSPQGIIFFKEENMPLRYNDLDVKIISRLASYDLNDAHTLEEIVDKLCEDEIISAEQLKRWSDEKGLLEFIHICQSVCTVLPVMNNDRLIRQRGAFLLPGKFNVTYRGENLRDAIITKAESNLRDEFDRTFFYIADDNKEKIRIELENCNISEANLFPELEYQLKYIRKHNEQLKRAVSYFEKFQKKVTESQDDIEIKDEYDTEIIKESINSMHLEENVANDIMAIFKANQTVDWLKRDSILSKIKILICKKLTSNNYFREDAEKISKNIIDKIIEKYTVR